MILTEQQQQIREMTQQFAQERIKPLSAEWDQKHQFPHDIIKEMGQLGLMGMLVPEVWGGSDTGYIAYATAIEAIASADGACSTIMSVHNSVVCMPILKYGSDQQKHQFLIPLAQGQMLGAFALTEPQAGTDASNLKTKAIKDGDDYIITGSKQFITSAQHADVVIVFAVTNPDAGKKGISAFLVPTDTAGYSVVRLEEKMGQHASDTGQIQLDGVRLSKDYLLGEEGQGYKIALDNLAGGRIGIAAQSVGMAQTALDVATKYAKERTAFGQPIIEHQAVGFRLADMATQVAVARQMVWHAASLRESNQASLVEASMAKLFASEMAEKVCSGALQTLGGYGYLKDFPVEQIYRDVRIAQIYEGTSDVQRIVISRSL
ncbi:butyryl-CoA dehydrogenase [Acinetobacter baylyi]|uniref:Butyryl-CoA dehydrogenase n=1 Tax=Acinetobacter baylyi TaxID=202950 RepID=A0ABU0USZ7_ACIBI|nr:acyl-CoA dehydrogenase family protein [Acinetobacter baylyi]MDQ1207677.1 butyryl-CoA dehydrogenase [Acinetobacter baylyi]MDR6105246.1 butyryl-CoA dehydrogenase [Acinetobacter baylyi]MDR6184548.1 butyryl-CoA dehydrogenase [Acinetobacter baylyi]